MLSAPCLACLSALVLVPSVVLGVAPAVPLNVLVRTLIHAHRSPPSLLVHTGEKIKTVNGNKINCILCHLPHMGRLWHAMEIWGDTMLYYVVGLWHQVVI